MKKTVYILALVCVPFFGFAQWGDPDNNSVSKDEMQTNRSARAQWTLDVIDVGTTSQNQAVQAKFEITNVGNAPLIISNVSPDCDCTAPEWPKAPIMPGQKAYIILEYDAESAGKFQKGAIVTMNTNPSQYNIVMKGIVQK